MQSMFKSAELVKKFLITKKSKNVVLSVGMALAKIVLRRQESTHGQNGKQEKTSVV